MKKHMLAAMILFVISFSFSSCTALHQHSLGDWKYNGNGHFAECACGYTLSESNLDHIDVKTENDTVYFRVEKNDGNTFFGDDIRYGISGSIDLKTYNLSYNVKESYYFDGEIMSYVDYDYNLTLTKEPIKIEFDFSGEFEEVYMDKAVY